LLLLSILPSFPLSAQDSQFGIRGLGTPGRLETVRVRSTAGAFGPFDALSPLTEASLGDLQGLAATAVGGTSYRDADVAGGTASLRATRFPVMGLAGPVFGRLVLSGGFTTYLDRTWDVTLRDSLLLRGTMLPYVDELSSDGGVTDLRFAAALRVSTRFALGAAVHVLSGSTRETAARTFDDTTYHAIKQNDETRYDGLGVSGSLLIDPLPELRLSLFARADGGRVRGRDGPRLRARSRAGRRRPRASAPLRRGTVRAGVDVLARLHRPAVNVYFHTFGCKANQYDTELVRQAFADQGAVV